MRSPTSPHQTTPPAPAKARAVTANAAELARLEAVVRRGWEAFIEVGVALKNIRDKELYLAAGYKTFPSYCLARFGYDKTRTSRAINGAMIGQSIKKQLPTLRLNEAQVRELIPLVKDGASTGKPNYQAAVSVVVEIAGKKPAKPITAERLRAAVDKLLDRGPAKPAKGAITVTRALVLADSSLELLSSPKKSSIAHAKAHLTELRDWLLGQFPAARVALAPVVETAGKKLTVFGKAKDPHGWLGNMWSCPVVHKGETYRTTEALFQCLRLSETDPVHIGIRTAIKGERSPFMAKRVAKKLIKEKGIVVSMCDAADLKRMELCLRLKLTAKPELIRLLLATGDSVIIEDCTKRPTDIEIDGKSHGINGGPFWGAALVDDIWRGQNALGSLWMELREEYRLSARP